MRKFFAIWIFKPVMIVLWLIHLDAAYAQGRRCSMGCNPTVNGCFYAARLAPFEKLLQHPDVRLRKVGKIGFDHFSKQRDGHLAYEKRAAIRGELA